MPIPKSTQGLIAFIKANGDAINDFLSGNKTLADLATFLDAQRGDSTAFVAAANTPVTFNASADHALLDKQLKLLDKIAATDKDLQEFKDDPAIFGTLLALRGGYFATLATTYSNVFAWVITFTPDEITRLNTLIRRSELDAAERQVQANVLDALVQLTKFAMTTLGLVL